MNGMRTWYLPLTWFWLHITISVVESQDTSSLEKCGDYEFRCTSGECVSQSLQCDGAKNCEDGSDETVWLCRQLDLKCSPSSFKCTYGACVDKDALCNGVQDCADNSDELHPSCFKANLDPVLVNLRCDSLYNFTCLSGECVDSAAVCDGQIDCKDGSDETLTQCYNMTCQPNSFQCAYGGCIDGDKYCNNIIDCPDKTDEAPGFCLTIDEEPVPQGSTVDESDPGCILPKQPKHGSYVLGGCKKGQESDYCESEPGTKVNQFTQLVYDCDRGYVLPVYAVGKKYETVSYSLCLDTGWLNQITCRKMCEPLFSEPHLLNCEFNGKEVPCDQYVRPGTTLTPRCKPFYHPLDPVDVYRQTKCMDDGEWQDPLFKCVPDCGKNNNSTYANRIAHGKPAEIGFHPWAIGLYKNDSGTYNAICGGTIISYKLILTAAHCIYDEQTGELIPASRFEVVTGKLNISWDSEELTQQKIGVAELVWPRSYKGKAFNLERDIAVLVLVRSIRFDEITMPACVDWKKKGRFHNGDRGHIAGWGLDESGHQSPALQSAVLPYKDLETCRIDLRNHDIELSGHETGYKEYITHDKFCAGVDEEGGNSVQPGDSGGGYTIVRNDQHFLIGILSNHPSFNNQFAVYTNVVEYIDWLKSNNIAETLT